MKEDPLSGKESEPSTSTSVSITLNHRVVFLMWVIVVHNIIEVFAF